MKSFSKHSPHKIGDGQQPLTTNITVSVALATYNGEKYIEAQLDSILAQSRFPAEIVICDDFSSDDTLARLRAYEERYPQLIRLYQNEQNLGFIHNFERAISLCTGDIIILCDQDDVWLPHKVERICDLFQNEPSCGFVFSDAEVTNGLLEPLGYNIYTRYQKPDLSPGEILPSFGSRMYFLGCTAAFRSKYRPFLLPISSDLWGHDHWIGFIMAVISNIRMIDEPLIYYRRHSSNVSSVVGLDRNIGARVQQKYVSLVAQRYERDCQVWQDMLQHLLKLCQIETSLFPSSALEEGIAMVRARIDFAEVRLKLRGESRLVRFPGAFRLLKNGDYTKYVRGLRTFIKDMIA